MKKLLIIIIVFLISFSICTFASLQAKACTAYTYTAMISPASTDVGLTGVSYTITFTDTGSSNMSSGTITIPTGYSAVSLTSVTASNGCTWSGSVSSPTISFTASNSDGEITTDQTVKVVFSATNPSSADPYTWTTTACSSISEGGTQFTICGSQPIVRVNSALVAPTVSASKGTVDQGQSSSLSSAAVSTGTWPYTYQWLQKAPSAGSYSSISGATSSSYSFATTSSTTTGTWSFELRVTDSACKPVVVTSTAVSVTVNVAPTVSVTPTSVTLAVGQSQTFSATASGGSGSYTYNWYVNSVQVSGQTSSSYLFTASAAGSTSVYAVVTDSANDSVTSNTVNFTVNKGTPTVSAPSLSPSGSTTAGTLVSLSVTVSGGGATPTGTATFQVNIGDGGWNNISSTVSLSSGYASTTYTPLTAASYQFQVVYSGDNNYNGATGSAASLTVTHGAAVSVVVSPASDSITAGSSDTFTALATDAYGNSWDDTGLVTWSINTASGTFTANSVMVTGAGGWTVTATDPDSVYGTASLTVTSAGLDQFVFSTVGTQTAGSFSITITAEDQYGNTVTGYTGTPSLSDLSGTISPTVTSAFVGGVWTGSVTVTLAGSDSITATDGAITGTSNTFTVTPASAVSIAVSPATDSITAGNSVTYLAMATDAYGNTWDDSASVTWSIDSGANGGWSSNVYTSATAGTWTVVATDPDLVTGTASLTVTHASAASITISPVTQTVSAGASQTYSATAADLFGNTWDVTGSVTWSIDSGAGGSWSGATYTSANAGSWTVKTALGGVSGTASLTVNAVTYQITVISAHGNPTASASVNAGDSFTASVTSPESAGVGQQWICTGYSIDGGSVVSGTSYTFTDIQSSHTITFNWQEQYYLTTSTNFGSADPVSGWYDAGSTVTLSATALSAGLGEQYVWNGWTGTGTGSYSGNDNPATNAVTMNGPITETASWTHQYELTVTSAYGSTSGQGWYNAGVSAPFSVNTPVSGGTGVQYALTSWSGSGTGAYSGSSSSSSVTMNNPITETANWQTQYQVTFAVIGGGSTIPTGSNVWENAGSLPILATPNTGYTFSSWSSNTGSITFNNANSATATATIGRTGTITATFAINTYTITVTQGANGVIAPGTITVDYGATPSFSITPNNGYHIASITVDGASVAVTSPSGQSYQFSAVSADGSLTATFAITTSTTPKGSSPSPTPLYVVLAAVIIVAAIILISIGIAIKRSRRKLNEALSNPETSI